MRPLRLDADPAAPLRILAVGAHCDDVEIGAGATLMRLAAAYPQATFAIVVLTSTPQREAESRAAVRGLLGDRATVVFHGLRDSRLPSQFDEVKDILGALAGQPWDLVLTHHRYDAHQDHRLLGEFAPTAFRNHLVLGFEVPKWDGDLGRSEANVYLPLTEADVMDKWNIIDRAYGSQRGKDWWSAETFGALARLRGIECRAPYAEAFRTEKAVLELPGETTRS